MKFIFLTVFLLLGTVYGSDKIRLEDVSVLTLYKGKMTNGRRASPIPQLECIGGSARCGAATPDVVQCYNRGSDGYDIQWECKADLDNDYRFGRVEVQCEGYNYPDDKYILKGSCGLKYELELTEAGRERRQNSDRSYSSYSHSYNKNISGSWGLSSLVGLIPIIGLIGVIYFCCLAPGDSTSDYVRPSAPSSPPPPGFIYDDPPDYNTATGGFAQRRATSGTFSGCGNVYPDLSGYSDSTYRQPRSGGLFSGFWSGATLGGIAGYLFGSSGRSRTYYHSDRDYYNPPRSSWFGGSGYRTGGDYSNSSERSSPPSRSSGSRMTSGFGGTSRR